MNRRTRLRKVVLLLAVVLLMAACTPQGGPTPTAVPSATPVAATEPSSLPAPAATPNGAPITLTWWTPDFLSPDTTQPGGALLGQQLRNFASATDGAVLIDAEVKQRYGKGGLLDYLHTAQPVAPSILPDLITLDLAEVEQAAALGLLRPLDGLLDDETLARLYPAGRTAGEFGGQRVAVPLVLDLEHVMYDRREVANSSSTWAGLLAADTSYLFPLGSPPPSARTGPGGGVQPVTLSHYLGGGYMLDPATRLLTLEEEPLLRVLTFYDDAEAQGRLAERPEDLVSLEAARQTYAPGAPALLEVSARQFLAEKENLQDWSTGAIPGWLNPSPPVASGWALAIVTPDPERQWRAAELIAWLVDPQHNGPHARAVGWLPASQEALDTWEEDDYRAHLGQQLQAAVAPPAGAESAAAAARLQEAVLAVVRDDVSPEQAARRALTPSQ
jgi:ABC-type glycerol-3-phosphate transport system substrate-binding protein